MLKGIWMMKSGLLSDENTKVGQWQKINDGTIASMTWSEEQLLYKADGHESIDEARQSSTQPANAIFQRF